MPGGQLEQLANLIKASKQTTPYTILLGSGLSMTPALLSAMHCKDWDAFDDMMSKKSPNEQYNSLHEPLNKLDLQEGYCCLVRLLKAGYFTILLTANFDDNLEKALRSAGLTDDNMDLLVVGEHLIEHIVSAIAEPLPPIKICLLHGRLSRRTIPNASQTLDFDPQLERTLDTYLARDMIVLGLNGRDFDILRAIPSGGGSLWYITLESTSFDHSIKTFQQKRKGETITGEDADFNSFFSQLAKLLGLQESEPTKASTSAIEESSGDVQISQPANQETQAPEAIPVETQKHLPDSDRADQLKQVPEETGGEQKTQLSDETITPVDSSSDFTAGKHWAVVVGVSDFEKGSPYRQLEAFNQLKTCDKDAEFFFEQLLVRGFHPSRLALFTEQTLTPPNHKAILSRLQSTARATRPGDVLLFYYSGLVDEDETDVYLVARDTAQQELQDTAVPVQEVMKILRSVSAKVLLLDIRHSRAANDSEDQKQHLKTCISRIREQAEGVSILVAYHERQSESLHSIFSSTLNETVAVLADGNSSGPVTLRGVYQKLKSDGKLFLAPVCVPESVKLYLHRLQTPDSFLILAYLYIVKVHKTLEDVQAILTRLSTIYESTCRYLLEALYRMSDPPRPQTTHPTSIELHFLDRLSKAQRYVVSVIDRLLEIRGICDTSSAVTITEYPRPILSDLANFLSRIHMIAGELRNELIAADADRQSIKDLNAVEAIV